MSVADLGPFSLLSTRANQPAPFHHSMPDPAELFLRSTSRLVWGGKKQLREWQFVLPGDPSCGLVAGMLQEVGVRGPEHACLFLSPMGLSTLGASSAASGMEVARLTPECGPGLN